VQGGFRDKHNNMGSLLLGAGVLIGVEGCVNTWMRTGKLFPGPHLFAGAGIVVLWALAAALVPAMQKGDNNARNMHIALNAVNVALFAWQVGQQTVQLCPWGLCTLAAAGVSEAFLQMPAKHLSVLHVVRQCLGP
jgi:hypothetical protein